MTKQNHTKKAALLASAMVVGGITPYLIGSHAQAASTPVYKTNLSKVYYGKSTSYTTKIKKVKAGQTVKFSVVGAGKNYISLSAKKIKIDSSIAATTFSVKKSAVTDNMAGTTAKIRAKIYSKKGNLLATLNDKITIAVDAQSLAISTAKFDTDNMYVGGNYDFDRIIMPAKSANKTYWSVVNAVTGEDCSSEFGKQGIWTPRNAGTYQVTATAKRTKTAKKVRATASVTVTIKQTNNQPTTPDTPSDITPPVTNPTDSAITVPTDSAITTPTDSAVTDPSKPSTGTIDPNLAAPVAFQAIPYIKANITTVSTASVSGSSVTTSASITESPNDIVNFEGTLTVQVVYNQKIKIDDTKNPASEYALMLPGFISALTPSQIMITDNTATSIMLTFNFQTQTTRSTAAQMTSDSYYTNGSSTLKIQPAGAVYGLTGKIPNPTSIVLSKR